MKIGYSVEGATDRALLVGLQRRWCPNSKLIEGRFRGTTDLRLRAEIPMICRELEAKQCDIIVFLTDANSDSLQDLGEIERNQKQKVPPEFIPRVLSGVAARNVESWLCADRDWIAGVTGRIPAEFDVGDPKGVFESAMEITSSNKREDAIADLVRRAPLRQWITRSRSFERFYDEARLLGQSAWGKSLQCAIPNERDKSQ
jgi:hypothetical protein